MLYLGTGVETIHAILFYSFPGGLVSIGTDEPLGIFPSGNKVPNSTNKRPMNERASEGTHLRNIKTPRHNPTSPGVCQWKPKPPSRMPKISGSLAPDFEFRLHTSGLARTSTGEPTGESKWDFGTVKQSFHFETKSTQCHHSSHSHGITMFSSRGAQVMEVNVICWSPSYPSTKIPSPSGSSSCHPTRLSPMASSSKPPPPCQFVPAAAM